MTYRRGNAVLVTVLLFGAALGLGAPAAASAAAPAPTFAVLRAAHFSPTTPGVDIYLGSFSGTTSTEWISGVEYGAVTPYRRVAPGLYTVSMRRHGMGSATPPMLSWTLDARPGKAYTAAGVGSGSSVRGQVIADDLRTPPAGQARVRVIQAASRAPALTLRAQKGRTIVRSARFATASAYATVHAGTWNLAASSDLDPTLHASTSIRVQAGQIQSVLVLDAKEGGITVRTLLDSAGSGAMPTGPINAGGGGAAQSSAADHHSVPSYLAWSVPVLALLAAASVLLARRTRRPRVTA